ncbi:unnamed protein product [Arabis nemorensis]|uniref:Plant bHLH transcription factor ACT-like domain-containing protein n=1 Tax=Arabis nemorensis TaxID=586526 RepID=A0A565BYZ8_9BRAS|nr:unnamed protein product [Arabis nemorensis]
MLQSEQDSSPFLSMKEPNFLALLSLQTLKEPWELESYFSRMDPYSPVQSETNHFYHNPISASSMEGTKQELSFSRANMTIPSSSSASPPHTANSRRKRKISHLKPQETTREKRKRRKTKPTKNIEEIENQRINHIAGDQASIVGGAINYVKVLEQIIQSLESQKRTQQQSNGEENRDNNHHLSGISSNDLWTTHEDQTCIPKIEATMIQNHVNLKIQCPKKQGQLLKGIISLEKLRLTVLHLNIASSSSHSNVSYSFNLKMEDDCDLGSSDEITAAVHRIFDIPTI